MMSRPTFKLAPLALAALSALAVIAPSAFAASTPAWQISLGSHPTNFAPGATAIPGNGQSNGGFPQYAVIAENVGAGSTSGPTTLKLQLPDGISPAAASAPDGIDQTNFQFGSTGDPMSCSVALQTVTCVDPEPVDPGEWVRMNVPVDVDSLPDLTALSALATISGGGAAGATTQVSTTVSGLPAPFGFVPGHEGLNASSSGAEGAAAAQAGSHPQQLNINLSLPTQRPNATFPIPDGALHDVKVDLPAGVVVDPAATPKCSAAQFSTFSCPDSSQVGIADIPIASESITPAPSQIYNVEPPPGHAAAFGFYVLYVPVTILGGVRPGDYRITSLTAAAPAILTVFNARIQLWGSPSDQSHDRVRGVCRFAPGTDFNGDPVPVDCPVSRIEEPLLTLPTSCAASMQADAHIDLWEQIGSFFDRTTDLADANGNSTAVSGCNQLQFDPTLKARPTTNLADSPTGLEAVLHIPQDSDVDTLATAHLRKALVTLPEGVAVNPSSANGLSACTSSQAGIDPDTGVPNGNTVTCPSASRIGKVEVDTPLLDHPLPGSVFVAMPHDNPFDSLLAIYVVVDDPSTNTLIKLPGHVVPDPQTGQLTTTFDNNPQLPFSDFKLDFFGGAYAALRTPSTCGTYQTTSSMTPWSAPDSGPPATPKDTWAITQSPSGGCASSEGALPNTPSFDAGSVSPIAGIHTPFVVNLRRNDATQQFSAVSLKPPPGLVAKLAGTPYCPESALTAAASKSGHEEKANPSCPAASQVGNSTVSAGAGPAPHYEQGKVYLTGPYKGAPLSMAIITPAMAGPYDLGTVVVKTALHVDPETAKITAISDPIPQILQGIPLDVRSASIALDKPNFSLNPTSCDPMAVSGTLTSTLGQIAPLESRFQLAECGRLAFKPKLSLRLKGGTKRGQNPALKAVLTMPPGGANIAKASVALPHSEFLDQSHINTVCTRVQFAAKECPAGSIYGYARAISPLLDAPLEGPVYLRSSSNPLPNMVADLNGQIHVALVGRIDSIKGGIRSTFDTAPDAPVSKFVLEMQGGRKGLLENSTNLCKSVNRATGVFTAHNAKTTEITPALKPSCKGKAKRKKHKRAR